MTIWWPRWYTLRKTPAIIVYAPWSADGFLIQYVVYPRELRT